MGSLEERKIAQCWEKDLKNQQRNTEQVEEEEKADQGNKDTTSS